MFEVYRGKEHFSGAFSGQNPILQHIMYFTWLLVKVHTTTEH